ncbi:MAG TPA: hypothetical protein VFI78_03890 [Salinimicrobium sp.]|nr:hypothetical protein [Salinimicrobium sp.]
MNVSIFLPTRKGSQRAPNKNTRKFGNFEGGLLELKLKQLVRVKNVREIVLSTNDERSMEIAEEFLPKHSKLKVIVRPGHLAASNTKLLDLIDYVPEIVSSEHILWTHVTSPFCDEKYYNQAIRDYITGIEDGFDSLVSVREFKNFLWDPEEKDIINRKSSSFWPNTQDLKDLFELNNAIFLASRNAYQKDHNRLGSALKLFEMKKIPSFDIDDEEDFKIAEAIYDKL